MDAGKCLVFSAEREGMQLIGVILRANNIWTESRTLLDFGFENYAMENGLKRRVYYLHMCEKWHKRSNQRSSLMKVLTFP